MSDCECGATIGPNGEWVKFHTNDCVGEKMVAEIVRLQREKLELQVERDALKAHVAALEKELAAAREEISQLLNRVWILERRIVGVFPPRENSE